MRYGQRTRHIYGQKESVPKATAQARVPLEPGEMSHFSSCQQKQISVRFCHHISHDMSADDIHLRPLS